MDASQQLDLEIIKRKYANVIDILTYDELELDEPGLRIPHARLRDRAFALVPLAEIDARWIPARDALPPGELAKVVELPRR